MKRNILITITSIMLCMALVFVTTACSKNDKSTEDNSTKTNNNTHPDDDTTADMETKDTQTGEQTDTPEQLDIYAEALLAQLNSGEYEKVYETFDAKMQETVTLEKLKEIWEASIKQMGGFKKKLNTRIEDYEGYKQVFVTCEFGSATMDVLFVFGKDNKVSGFFFSEPPETSQEQSSKTSNELFSEEDVYIGEDEWKLPGTLTIPENSEAKVPVVILVHGSGPSDRDETVFNNKPFRDLAHGLASNGIAVLRYDKRTRVFGARMPEGARMTVQYEVIDDVLKAVELVKQRDEIDSNRIYVLGHSLGATLIPRIGQQTDDAAGFIMMAGSVTPIYDLMPKQYQYIYSLDGEITDDEQEVLDEIEKQVKIIKSSDLSKEPEKNILNVPAEYWHDLKNYKPDEAAAQLNVPLLILQGKRDYQVTVDELELWKKALGSKDNVEFKIYPKLNHLFMEGTGEGKSSPDEYKTEQHIPEEVIKDISNWIKGK